MNAKEEAPSGALKARTTPYVKLHKLVNRLYPRSGRCEHCGATDRRTQYAGKSHDHYTAEREDWLELCGSCHKKYDGQIPVEAIASNVGRSPSAETRAKISAAHMGRMFTPEWRAKIARTNDEC